MPDPDAPPPATAPRTLTGQLPLRRPARGLSADEAVKQAHAALQAGQLRLAESLLRQADVVKQRHGPGMHLLGIVCASAHRYDEAEALWQPLLPAPDQHPGLLSNYGRMLQQAGRYGEALPLLTQAVARAPDDYTARLNLGVCFQHMGRHAEAREHTEVAARLRPDLAQPLFNLGRIHQSEYAFEAAHDWYEKTLALDPVNADAASNLLFTQHYLTTFDPARLLARAASLGDALCAGQRPRFDPTPRAKRPLRVGLLSADLCEHPVGWFLAGFLPLLDSGAIHITAYSNSTRRDPLTARLRAACAAWRDIATLNDDEAADQIARDGIDVLMDLSGLTAGNRLGVLARKPARVLVNWLGYFGTTGLPTVDHILADPFCVPPGEEPFYRENVWRLPHSRFCMAPPADSPEVSPLPALAAGEVTLGSFQELSKINGRVLQVWARVFQALPKARLRVQSARLALPHEHDRLLQRLIKAGIEGHRVQLLPAINRAEYLRAHREVDFVVDTFPYTGGTTTCEALWMGVPTLTLAEPGMLGRQGQAHLSNVDLPDWIALSEDRFVALATHHASAAGLRELAALRADLRRRCQQSALFDNQRFAADWTQALRAMHRSSLSPSQPQTSPP